jgi:hypothetical protein
VTNPLAGDCRRASALVLNYGRRDHAGVNAILQESAEADRVTDLILATLTLFQSVVPILITDYGMHAMGQVILGLAQDRDGDDNVRRAAALVAHDGNSNVQGINAILQEASETTGISELILNVMHLYATILPSLFTPLGLDTLQRNVLDLAAKENE